MEKQTTPNSDSNFTDQIIKQVVTAWTAQNDKVTAFFTKHDDEVYLNEIAPGRNRGIYLLGHLVSVSDRMLPLLGLGEKMFPHLEDAFINNPDKTVTDIPSMAELKENWKTVSSTLNNHFAKMSAGDWMGRHTTVSEEDFAADPTRNKLNVVISRTTHMAYHIGQLNLLVPKAVTA